MAEVMDGVAIDRECCCGFSLVLLAAIGHEQRLAALPDTRHSDHLTAEIHTKTSEHFVRPTALPSHRDPSVFAQ